jgi:ABC-type phosphate/phosphonate transport system substrate-binding protein
MKEKVLVATLLVLAASGPSLAFGAENMAPKRIRIGIDIRLGFQSCMDSWMPVAKHLSKEIPHSRFVVVPLASRQDIVSTLEKGDIEFIVLDPAMAVVANDQYFTTPLLTMLETDQGKTPRRSSDAASSGTLIRRADRNDIRHIQDMRGLNLSAVKPWSLPGWIAQWGLLVKHGIDPQMNLKQVVFEGTNGQVVKSVVEGAADVGAVDADMLLLMIRDNQVPSDSLCFFNREGIAVPLVAGGNLSSTDAYPGRVLCKTQAVSDALAQSVVDALRKNNVSFSLDRIPYEIRWTIACNDGKVRRLLQELMGPNYAESPGFPLPKHHSAWLLPAAVIAAALFAFAVMSFYLCRRSSWRGKIVREQLEHTRHELVEVRAEKQRIDSILALAGCGIDIVDDDNQIVYADSCLEREYGDWHGRKCHDYYCGSSVPCAGCLRPFPINRGAPTYSDLDGSDAAQGDPHAKPHCIKGESSRMIGIPFYDEGGRWLYARIHFPLSAFAVPYVGVPVEHV